MERAALVDVVSSVDEASKRAIRLVRLKNFRIELFPRSIKTIVDGEGGRVLRVV